MKCLVPDCDTEAVRVTRSVKGGPHKLRASICPRHGVTIYDAKAEQDRLRGQVPLAWDGRRA